MKIDLYNNHQTFIKEAKQNYGIDKWCRELGVSRTKIETHPHIADIRVLIELRAYSTYFNKRDNQVYTKIWRQVYEHEYPLTAYHKRKLLQVIASVEYTRTLMKKAVTMMTKKGGPLTEPKLTEFSV